jgi:hypothetical protein
LAPDLYNVLHNNTVQIVKKTSIQRPNSQPNPTWTRFPGCPEFGDSVIGLDDETKKTKKISKYRFCKDDNCAMRSWKKKIEVRDPVQLEIITRTIRTRFCKEYTNIRVSKVFRDDAKIYVNVTGEGANWCLNLNPPRNHTSNSIWFQFDKKGCCVKCFCRKPDTKDRRNNTPCGNFASQHKTLNSREQEKLFPITKTIKK